MLWYEILMLWYEISVPWYKISMIYYAMLYDVKGMLKLIVQ